MSTELSAKGAIECWELAPRTHDLVEVVDDILATRTLEPDVRR
ncbi:MAG: hypothetical protein RMK49_02140 [Abditibacteriales bacterium]|nr:hypothetical protein [Abditibacteriales bacterium]